MSRTAPLADCSSCWWYALSCAHWTTAGRMQNTADAYKHAAAILASIEIEVDQRRRFLMAPFPKGSPHVAAPQARVGYRKRGLPPPKDVITNSRTQYVLSRTDHDDCTPGVGAGEQRLHF